MTAITTAPADPDDPDSLRRRAELLRTLATRVERTAALRLHSLAGTETWRTPRAELCEHLLAANRAQARHAIDELMRVARRLDERADEIVAERAAMESTG